MKFIITLLVTLIFLLLLSAVLITGVVVLQEPKCATASPQERLEMRCQKALYEYRG